MDKFKEKGIQRAYRAMRRLDCADRAYIVARIEDEEYRMRFENALKAAALRGAKENVREDHHG